MLCDVCDSKGEGDSFSSLFFSFFFSFSFYTGKTTVEEEKRRRRVFPKRRVRVRDVVMAKRFLISTLNLADLESLLKDVCVSRLKISLRMKDGRHRKENARGVNTRYFPFLGVN